MLVASARHSAEDLRYWCDVCEQEDAVRAQLTSLTCKEERALDTMERFSHKRNERCYVGVSWGKDSMVLAHLTWRLRERGVDLPMVWVKVEPIYNPECPAVRDGFLVDHECRYDEIVIHCWCDDEGWHASGTLERGFDIARSRYGRAHLSGVRGEESGIRRHRMQRWGCTSPHTCAPIGWWQPEDVFAYIHKYELPLHPAYAMTHGGMWDRRKIRVASLGGQRGRGFGRGGWELKYYPDRLRVVVGRRKVVDATL